ncbi:hypothetical protein FPV67DRAFT_1676297 [Lyophyllum atratum]|nr:hypothetical protein FPV67DRAFT_1676297 [Lyophyllum atratum]
MEHPHESVNTPSVSQDFVVHSAFDPELPIPDTATPTPNASPLPLLADRPRRDLSAGKQVEDLIPDLLSSVLGSKAPSSGRALGHGDDQDDDQDDVGRDNEDDGDQLVLDDGLGSPSHDPDDALNEIFLEIDVLLHDAANYTGEPLSVVRDMYMRSREAADDPAGPSTLPNPEAPSSPPIDTLSIPDSDSSEIEIEDSPRKTVEQERGIIREFLLKSLANAGHPVDSGNKGAKIQLPWGTLGKYLAEAGLRILNWPHDVPFPGENMPAKPKASQGIKSLATGHARTLRRALQGPDGEGPASTQDPVIVSTALPDKPKHNRYLYADGEIRVGAEARRPPAPTSTAAKGKSVKGNPLTSIDIDSSNSSPAASTRLDSPSPTPAASTRSRSTARKRSQSGRRLVKASDSEDDEGGVVMRARSRSTARKRSQSGRRLVKASDSEDDEGGVVMRACSKPRARKRSQSRRRLMKASNSEDDEGDVGDEGDVDVHVKHEPNEVTGKTTERQKVDGGKGIGGVHRPGGETRPKPRPFYIRVPNPVELRSVSIASHPPVASPSIARAASVPYDGADNDGADATPESPVVSSPNRRAASNPPVAVFPMPFAASQKAAPLQPLSAPAPASQGDPGEVPPNAAPPNVSRATSSAVKRSAPVDAGALDHIQTSAKKARTSVGAATIMGSHEPQRPEGAAEDAGEVAEMRPQASLRPPTAPPPLRMESRPHVRPPPVEVAGVTKTSVEGAWPPPGDTDLARMVADPPFLERPQTWEPAGYDAARRYAYDEPRSRYTDPLGYERGDYRGGYPDPRSSHNISRGAYDPPRGAIDDSRGNFDDPRPRFDPRSRFDEPPGGYDTPHGSYNDPRGGYDVPRGRYEDPRGMYGPPRGMYHAHAYDWSYEQRPYERPIPPPGPSYDNRRVPHDPQAMVRRAAYPDPYAQDRRYPVPPPNNVRPTPGWPAMEPAPYNIEETTGPYPDPTLPFVVKESEGV